MFIELAFILSFLYDLYTFTGFGRLIDIFILVFLPTYIILKNYGSREGIIYYREFIIWLIIFAISSQSLFSRDYRSIITFCGLAGGFLIYLSLRYVRFIPNLKTIKRIGYAILTVQFLESFLYYIFKYNLNFVSFFGGVSNRGLNESIFVFRPSSIYQEPSGLAISLFFILTLTILVPERNLLESKINNTDKQRDDYKIYLHNNILQFIRENIVRNLYFLLLICLAIFLSGSLWGTIITSIFLSIIFSVVVFSRKELKKFKINIFPILTFLGITIISFINLLNNVVFRTTYVNLTFLILVAMAAWKKDIVLTMECYRYQYQLFSMFLRH